MGKGNAYENVTTPADAAEFILFRPGVTENVTYEDLRESISSEIAITTELTDPEGVLTATANTLIRDVYGRLWYKASGSGNTGWVLILADSWFSVGGGDL